MSSQTRQGVTINSLQNMREQGQKIACLTAYDASFAKLLDNAGIDIILVGDSLGMVIQGNNSTVSVTMEDMLYHTQCVTRATEHAMVITDMPFMSYSNIDSALTNATLLMQDAGAQMVKLEATERQTEIVNELSACGIPVCAHLGLRPQYVHKLGGYQTQGADRDSAEELLKTSIALEQAGADLLLVECIPAQLAFEITKTVSIPVIGIGAGKDTDGQILVLQDILGITPNSIPSFVKNFMQNCSIQEAVEHYIDAVKSGTFPI
ncbi:MAG: 3-methyl-2-oxobutanoate hydroxymethyltransferase [Pseudomonadota bacterium]